MSQNQRSSALCHQALRVYTGLADGFMLPGGKLEAVMDLNSAVLG